LFAKALENANVKDLITNIGSAVGAVPAAGAAGMNISLEYYIFLKCVNNN
jgi:ribosomal protein L12E/L44/L45/RPP1/RPP2